MKYNWKLVLIVSLTVYVLLGTFRDIVDILATDRTFKKYNEGWVYLLNFSGFISFFPYALFSYSLFFFRGKIWDIKLLIIALCLASPFIIFFRYVIQEVLFDIWFGATNYNDQYTLGAYFMDNLYYAVIYYAIGITTYNIEWQKYSDRIQTDLVIQNKKTELALLRSQLNPHFLFNVLNTIYALINKKSKDSLVVVSKLSSLLRYSLYGADQFVKVQSELDFISDFIQIQRFRYNHPIHIDMVVEPEVLDKSIPPFLFIPFIENAFKHGDMADENQPLIVKIFIDQNRLCFTSKNRIKAQEKDTVGGIGIENISKRLDLLYEDRYTLNMFESEMGFTVELKVPL